MKRSFLFIGSILVILTLFVVCNNPFLYLSGNGNRSPQILDPPGSKTNPTVTWPTDLTAVIGQTLLNVRIPGNGTSVQAGTFSWTTPGDSVGALGVQSHNMIFTPNDTENFNTITNNVNVSVHLIQMVSIPRGTFMMGSPPGIGQPFERPQRQVTVSAFFMGKYTITQDEWVMVMGSNPSHFHGGPGRLPATGEIQGRRPVEMISWYDAIVFSNKLSIMEGLSPAYMINNSTNPADWGPVPTSNNPVWNAVTMVTGSTGYRLPTEAQWEYACRAGSATRWHFGDNESLLGNFAWYGVSINGITHQVGRKLPNAFHLYDMHGNIWEWVWDWNAPYPSNAPAETDPTGSPVPPTAGDFRAFRGGGFGGSPVFQESARRSVNRNPNYTRDNIGLRVVLPYNAQ